MAEDDIAEFIKNKNKFIEDDFKLRFFVNFLFLDGSKYNYDNLATLLDKKLRTSALNPQSMKKFLNTNPFKKSKRTGIAVYGASSCSGFLADEEFIFKNESANASKEEKENNFFEALKSIVSKKTLIPDRSVILLTQDKHHMARSKRKLPPLTSSAKKLKIAIGTKPITEYFPISKSSNESSTKKTPPEPYFKYRAEEIIYKLRGDEAKILWIPENHSELDPMSYISIIIKSEICQFMETNQDETTLAAIKENLSTFPDNVWVEINEQIKRFENVYLERNGDVEFDQDEGEEESDDENKNCN